MSGRIVRTAPAPEDTREIGQEVSAFLRDGDTVVLEGELGAGKSELARGIARGLGYTGPVPSPSFTILNEYEGGRLPLHHFDWYRLADSEELYESGLNEFIGAKGVCVIEWSERAPDALPESYLRISLLPLEDGTRRITISAEGGYPAPEALFGDGSREKEQTDPNG